MKMVKHTAEAFTFSIVVTSVLDTSSMVVCGLATKSSYGVMVMAGSEWGSSTLKIERYGKEAQCI